MISPQILRSEQHQSQSRQPAVQSIEYITPDSKQNIETFSGMYTQQQQPQIQTRTSRSRSNKISPRQQLQTQQLQQAIAAQNYQPTVQSNSNQMYAQQPQFQTYQNMTNSNIISPASTVVRNQRNPPEQQLFKVPSPPPPLINASQSIMKPSTVNNRQNISYQQQQLVNQVNQSQLQNEPFKMPTMPLTTQSWSPPPSVGKQQPQLSNYQSQPVQLIQVSDLNNTIQVSVK